MRKVCDTILFVEIAFKLSLYKCTRIRIINQIKWIYQSSINKTENVVSSFGFGLTAESKNIQGIETDKEAEADSISTSETVSKNI